MQMFQRCVVSVVAVGLAASMSGTATAQETKPMGLSVRVGIFMPTQSEARDLGSNWFSGGLEYKIKDLGFGIGDPSASTSLTVSVDFMGKGQFQHVPVLVNYVGRRNEIYWTVGAGVGLVRADEVVSIGLPVMRETKSSTSFAYQFGVGYDFQQGRSPVFIEARYFGSGKNAVNGLGIFLGMRL